MRIVLFIVLPLFIGVGYAQEAILANAAFKHPAYFGLSGGYGSTTWQGLVPSDINKNEAISISTPVTVNEGGSVWGAFAGFELTPYFALEAGYMRYPNAIISFDEFSLFAFDHDGLLDLYTHTETISVMAKVMLFIPKTDVRLYSSAGAAEVHRWDNMTESRRISPTFGVGFNYPVSEHVMAEIGGNYTAGYGESELNPAKDYVPFLYSGVFRLAYRI